jgi:hypothetical protein
MEIMIFCVWALWTTKIDLFRLKKEIHGGVGYGYP